MLCQEKDCHGLVYSSNSLDSEAMWKCSKCGLKTSPADVSRNIELWEAEIESLPMDKDRYEDQLVRLQKLLHPNHSLILDLKCTLCQLYGRENRGSEADMLVEARRKKELCLQVLETMDMVIPGRFRLRGMFLFELYVVSMYLLKKEDKFSGVQKQLLERLLDLRSVLSEAQEILGYEAPGTIEGARAKTAGEYRVRLDDMIRHLEEKIKTSGSSSDDRPHGNGFKEEKE